jgi:putative SbcD/Mre11-related phosphoesterase
VKKQKNKKLKNKKPLVSFFERALKIRDFLIIADLHLGMSELLIEKGSFLPRFIEKEVLNELKELKRRSNAKILIINGDIKHDFGKEKEEFFSLARFLKEIKKIFEEIIIIQGNHDNYIKNVALKLGIRVVKRVNLGNKMVITHGDTYFKDFEENKIFIIANEHPFLKIAKFNLEIPVFLLNKRLIVIPAFNKFLSGSNVLNKDFLSPYLKKINDVNIIYAKEGKITNFGKLKLK